MTDEDLRGRFRRDYTNEQIGKRQQPKRSEPAKLAVPESPSVPPAPVQPTPTAMPEDIPPITGPISLEVPPTQRAAHPHKKRKSRRVLPLIFIFLLLAAAGGAAAYYEYGAKKQPLIPASVKTKSSVKLLYPYQLPTGYAVVNSSFSVTSDKVLYYAADNAGNRLNFTVQTRPQNFDFEKFYTQVLSNTTKFTTPLGEGAVGTTNGILMGSLATTSSWAIVTGNSNKVSGDTIQQALKGLKFASY